MQIKKQVDIFNASITRKAVIRYLTIVMDFSAASLKQDLRPNRAIVMKDKISVSLTHFNHLIYSSLPDLYPRIHRAEPAVQDFDNGNF